MLEMLQLPFMVQALIACVVMGLLLSYLGIHVVERGIVFVDLALGQISSLGVAFATFIGGAVMPISIVFTLLGAFLLSLIHIKDKRLKQEAIIGIIYAVASAVTVLLISKTPHGEADISEVLFGNILAIRKAELTTMLVLFIILGLIHAVFYRQIFRVTNAIKEHVVEKDTKFHFWNFFFYVSIGLAIVYAVRAGGVIPVFSYLVIPPVAAILLTRRDIMVAILAPVLAILASFFGLYFSYTFDFPAGSSIVAIFGAIFTLCALVKFIFYRKLAFKESVQRVPEAVES
ncbi:MAG: metal ABC transporter permease [Calditrichaeota bacterium]|nr:MAG: metal ABC transporter permease [Calditrichota bacterium]